ncbi:MAG TPA: hypothetical protein VHF26_04535 [Trebonia sp.]|nr:hypothetical protein [Trebonia sp.]
MKFKHLIVTGALSLSAAAGVAAPAYAAPGPHHPAPRPVAAFAVDHCALAVNIARPHAGQVETLTVKSTVPGTTVRVAVRGDAAASARYVTTPASRTATEVIRVGVRGRLAPTPVTVVGTVVRAPWGFRAGDTCATTFVRV